MNVIDPAYGCQAYDINRLCRFDRRAVDRKCDGCLRVTDREYIESNGCWIPGISHVEEDSKSDRAKAMLISMCDTK